MIDPLESRTLFAHNPNAGGLSNSHYNYVQRLAQTALFEQQLADLIASNSSNSSILSLGDSLASDASRTLTGGTGNNAADASVSSVESISGATFNTTNLSAADAKTFNKLTKIKTSPANSGAFDNTVANLVRKLTNRQITQSNTVSRAGKSNTEVRALATSQVADNTALQKLLPALTVSNRGTLSQIDYQFLQHAAQRATFQIALNELIQEKSFNSNLTTFGTNSAADAATVIGTSGTVDTILAASDASYNTNTLDPDDAKIIAQLAKIDTTAGNSAAFDTAVLAAERKSNLRALAYAQAASLVRGNNPDVRTLAATRVTTETLNQSTLDNLQTSVPTTGLP